MGPRPAGSDDSKFKDLLHPKFKRKTHIFYQNKEELDHTEEKQYAPPALQPAAAVSSPRRQALAGQPWRPVAGAQKYSALIVKQQPQTRWWVHRNIPRANLMHHANVQGPSLEQELAREISGAPRREHFGHALLDPTTARLKTCFTHKSRIKQTFLNRKKDNGEDQMKITASSPPARRRAEPEPGPGPAPAAGGGSNEIFDAPSQYQLL